MASKHTGKSKPEFKQRKKMVKVRPYGMRVHLIVSNDILKSYKKLRLPGGVKVNSTAYAFVWSYRGCTDVYAFLPEKCGLGATAHEMLHVTTFILSEVGVEISRENDEVMAYHLEELTEIAAEFVHETPKRKR